MLGVRVCGLLPFLLLNLTSPLGGQQLVDRIVAVVDRDPILLSDIQRVIGLGLVERREGEAERELQRRVLEGLIDQRLRLQEVERSGSSPVRAEEVEGQLEAMRQRFGDAAAFADRLAALGLDEERLRHLLSRQLAVLRYIDERLSPRLFVDLEAVRSYYRGPFQQQLAERGIPAPPLAEVREEIRALLREQRLNEEIEEWTRELRLDADVVDYFDRDERELPPILERIEEEPPPHPYPGGSGRSPSGASARAKGGLGA